MPTSVHRLVRIAALCAAMTACTFGPSGETVGCACAEEYFEFADIDRWRAGAARNDFSDMAKLEHYYRAKGWHGRADVLFKRRLEARDPAAVAVQKHLDDLQLAAAKHDTSAIAALGAHFKGVGRLDDERRMHNRLVEIGDDYALDEEGSQLFREAISLADANPLKLKKLHMAQGFFNRMSRQVAVMDAVTLRGSGLSYLLQPNEGAVASRTLVAREIRRLEN